MSLLVQWSGWAVMSLAIATCSGGAKEGGMHEDHLNENAARAVLSAVSAAFRVRLPEVMTITREEHGPWNT